MSRDAVLGALVGLAIGLGWFAVARAADPVVCPAGCVPDMSAEEKARVLAEIEAARAK